MNDALPPSPDTPKLRRGRPPGARKQLAREPVHEDAREAPRDPKRLTRTRRRTEDKFFIDPKIIPPGMSYQWVRETCYGMPDSDHVRGMQENHWTPVPPERHPSLNVKKDGLRLMERPAYLTEEAKAEELAIARGEVTRAAQNAVDTPDGTMTRAHPSARKATTIRKEYSPLQISED